MCDIDNTLSFASEAVVAALNARFGLSMKAMEQKVYRISTTLPVEQGMWLDSWCKSSIFYTNMAPDFHAVDAAARIRAAGYELVIATNRDPSMQLTTAQWLSDWGIGYDQLLLGPTVKIDFCKAHPNTVAIDDDPAKAVLLPPLGATLWMPARPYTPTWVQAVKNVHVFSDWSDVLIGLGV
jgi:hypothetical protein